MKTVGSRAEVFHGNATRTSGRLTKDDLMKNKAGRIVSKKRHNAGKNALRYLHAKGYIATKGAFGCKKSDKDKAIGDTPINTTTDANPLDTASDPFAL
jgi:hypothetical protein